MCRSAAVSSAEVASSRIRIGVSRSSARAMAMRWRCPPESSTPRSPTSVSSPCGSCSTNSMHVGRTRGRLQLRLVDVGGTEQDIVADGVVEQHHFLAHQADLPAQVGQRGIRGCRHRRSARCPRSDRRSAAAATPASTCRCQSARRSPRWCRRATSSEMSRSTAPFSATYSKLTWRNSTAPRARASGCDATGRLARRVEHLEHRLAPAAMPCCIGPATVQHPLAAAASPGTMRSGRA